MQFFEEMRESLKAALDPKTEVRKRGEQEIRNYRDQDTKKFMATLTRDIADEGLDGAQRQLACLILKNFILNQQRNTTYENYWIQLDGELRSQIKLAILGTLASPVQIVRGQVASLIAAIASLEIPRREWDDLLPNLSQNAEHEDFNIRMSSLTTLGYICEEIQPSDVTDPIKNGLILALINNMSASQAEENLTLTRIAARALSYSIPFASQNFRIQHERDYIMDRIFQSMDSNDEETQEYILQCLAEISTQEYEHLQHYFSRVCMLTQQATRSTQPRVAALAYEFWTTLIEDEIERKQKPGSFCLDYVAQCKEELVELVLQGLLLLHDEEDSVDVDQEQGPCLAAGSCLQALALLIRNDIMDLAIKFVAANIQAADDWKMRFAGLIALGSITDGPDKQKFLEVIAQALNSLFLLFSDQSPKVRQAICWVFSRLSEHHPDIFLDQQVAEQFIPRLRDLISDKARISNQCCAVFEKLAAAHAPQNEEASNCLTPYFQDLMQKLMMNAGRDQATAETSVSATGVDLQQASYMTMTTLVQHCCTNSYDLVYQLMFATLQHLEQSVKSPPLSGDGLRRLQDLLCGLLQVQLVKIGDRVDASVGNNIIQLIIGVFQQANCVTENGLIAFQGFCVGVPGLGQEIKIDEIACFVKYALQSEEQDCVKIACGIVSDMSSSMQGGLDQYLGDFVPCLQHILRNESIHRSIKLPAFHALGDLSLNSGDNFNKVYLHDTLTVLDMAAQMTSQAWTDGPGDTDYLEFIQELRDEIIVQYSTILISVGDSQDEEIKKNYEQHLPQICEFIAKALQSGTGGDETALPATPKLTQGASGPDNELLADPSEQRQNLLMQLTGLVMDLAQLYRNNQELKQALTQPAIEGLLNALHQYPDQESKETASGAYESISKMCAQSKDQATSQGTAHSTY